ncbi:hypothetical protein Droror1_Dr00011982 [Drosera rotundifolia]
MCIKPADPGSQNRTNVIKATHTQNKMTKKKTQLKLQKVIPLTIYAGNLSSLSAMIMKLKQQNQIVSTHFPFPSTLIIPHDNNNSTQQIPINEHLNRNNNHNNNKSLSRSTRIFIFDRQQNQNHISRSPKKHRIVIKITKKKTQRQ